MSRLAARIVARNRMVCISGKIWKRLLDLDPVKHLVYLNAEAAPLDLRVYSAINAPKIIETYLSSAPVFSLNCFTT